MAGMPRPPTPAPPDASADVLAAALAARQARRTAVLATVVEATGSTPQRAGAKLLLDANGRAVGTVGGGQVEARVLEAAGALLAPGAPAQRLVTWALARDLGMACGGEMKVFLERLEPAERLLLFGAGHLGRALCAVAAGLGFEVTVVDGREAWASPSRFPGAATSCVVATHTHQEDETVVRALLATPARFVGMVGSARKRDAILGRLRQAGVGEADLGRLRTPVGLAIGAVTP
jgi:xanthine dehydrogenase accessory factor